MIVELRADGVHISGYVNVPGRESRPVITPHGRVIEVIEQRAFARAIQRAECVDMLVDHDTTRKVASTKEGTLQVQEDEVGLRAEAVVTDAEVIKAAREKRLRGWSFNMRHPKDSLEERADKLPLRRVTDFDMTEISLIINKNPIYNSTSIEVRADGEGEEVELRASCEVEMRNKQPLNAEYTERLKALERKGKDV